MSGFAGVALPESCAGCGGRAFSVSWTLASLPLPGRPVRVKQAAWVLMQCRGCHRWLRGVITDARFSADGSRVLGGTYTAAAGAEPGS